MRQSHQGVQRLSLVTRLFKTCQARHLPTLWLYMCSIHFLHDMYTLVVYGVSSWIPWHQTQQFFAPGPRANTCSSWCSTFSTTFYRTTHRSHHATTPRHTVPNHMSYDTTRHTTPYHTTGHIIIYHHTIPRACPANQRPPRIDQTPGQH